MFTSPPDHQILASMIAPALFMTATGSLIISTNNRLARIIDRIRVVIGQLEALMRSDSQLDVADLRRKYLTDELDNLRQRAVNTRSAGALLYFAFSMFVSSSLTIGFDLVLPFRLYNLPTLFTFIGVTALFWASINLFFEMRTAMRTVDHQLNFLDDWQRERIKSPDKLVDSDRTIKE